MALGVLHGAPNHVLRFNGGIADSGLLFMQTGHAGPWSSQAHSEITGGEGFAGPF
jgi:hypothetical protein